MRPILIICACVAILLVGREMPAREIYTVWGTGGDVMDEPLTPDWFTARLSRFPVRPYGAYTPEAHMRDNWILPTKETK